MSKDMLGIAVRKLVTLPSQTLGIVCDFLEKLSDPEWVEAMKKFLRKENPWPTREWNIWKTLKLGTGLQTADDFRHALKDNGNRIGGRGNDILGQPAFTVSPEETEVNLVIVSAAELGFKSGAPRADVHKKAQELGLQLCPAEIGPQLRLQYKGQPRGEWLFIGMEPITDSDGCLRVFAVGHYFGGRQLDGNDGYSDLSWLGCSLFVFILPGN